MNDTITLPRATVQQVLEAIDLYQRNEHCEDELLIAGHFLRTALEQQQAEPVGWKPIETAPKDAIVLLCLPLIGNIREGDRRVYEGRWHEAQATWTSVNGFLLFGAATNWMPLPQPPITTHGIKEGT